MKKYFIILVLLIMPFMVACQQKANDEMISISPDQKSDIVVFFKKGTKNEEINYFLDNVAGRQRADGRGTEFLDGMQSRFQIRNQDYEGVAIELRENATQGERENILKAINSSPLVYKVFENVVPNEVVLDPVKAKQEKEAQEKLKNDNRPNKTVVVTNSTENKR
jgi:hypothetical protein